MNRDKRMTVELQEDVATGELFCLVPEAILSENCWYEGTVVEWVFDGDELILREPTQWLPHPATTYTLTENV